MNGGNKGIGAANGAENDAGPAAVKPMDKPLPGAWFALGILFLVYVLNFIDRQIITILAPHLKADLKLNDADIGFLYGTAFAIFYALFGIPLGRLADSWHRVRLLSIGLALWSAMTALSGLARNSLHLGLARMGVGVGEATAGPAAYSLISDMFPKHMRGTALAIYSAGLFFGGGVSLMIGGAIVDSWDKANPGGGAFGLVGWQVAFLAVGFPGLLLALIVLTIREPVRGLVDGLATPASSEPFRGFLNELVAAIPPFTLIAAAQRGMGALARNLGAAVLFAIGAWVLTRLTGNALQWICIAGGYYAVFSWASALRDRDPESFRHIWGSRAFITSVLGYTCVSFLSYSSTGFAPVYAQDVLGEAPAKVGLWVGGAGAVGGFLGVILGGRLSDFLMARNAAGRVLVIIFGLVAPILPVWMAFTTTPTADDSDLLRFTICVALANMLGSSALGAAAATTQDLVLPRMRGTATATFFVGTTLAGLALGPYLTGFISARTGDLSLAVRSIYLIVPVGLALLAVAYRDVPRATARLRAEHSGE